jgi:3-dehydroquinate synthase
MDSIRQHLRVSFSYPICFTRGVFEPSNALLRDIIAESADQKPARFVVVVDEGVARTHPTLADAVGTYARTYADTLELGAPVLVVTGGEAVKNEAVELEAIHALIHDARLCRHSYLVAVGGGAVLDTAGYAAATAHRGIRLIRIPTTVLAQDDSGVGVKNGVNGFGTKNYYGTFAPPAAVINDFAFLSTLADRDWLGGLSEAVKVALIKDPVFFARIEADAAALVARDTSAMEAVVRRSAELHAAHIATGGDPFELGSSRPLDFGHWAAHRLEKLTRHQLRHGEAVAIGIALDCTYSRLEGHLAEADWRRIIALLRALRLPIFHAALAEHAADPDHPDSVLLGLEQFREHLGGQLTIMLLRGIGNPFDVHDIRREGMIRSIDVLREIDATAPAPDGGDSWLAASVRGPA